jgi:hypothetical protein
MDRKVIYTTGFKVQRLSDKKGPDKAKLWVDYRYEVWKRYTLNSILNQNNPNWEYWFIVDDLSHELLGDRVDEIKQAGVNVVFRYHEIEQAKKVEPADYYMVLRLDSDDMYRQDVTDEMLTCPITDGHGLFRYVQYLFGYVYKPNTGQVKEWWRRHMSPPFFARIYPNQEWFGMVDADNFTLFDGGHEQVRLYKRTFLGRGRFCVGIHYMNMVTHIGKRTEIFDGDEKKRIMAGFGVDYPEPDFLSSENPDIWEMLPNGWQG